MYILLERGTQQVLTTALILLYKTELNVVRYNWKGAGLAHQPQLKHSPCLWLVLASQVFNYSMYLMHVLQSHTKMKTFAIRQANADW